MILAFGSINADLIFSLARLPRRGETVLTEGYRLSPGGKGANQAVAAAQYGADVRFVGAVGRDGNGDACLDALIEAGVDVSEVARVDAVTGTAVVAVEHGGENQIVVASGANRLVRADWLPERWLGPETTLLLQLELQLDQTRKAIAKARERGCRIILNTAPAAPLSSEDLAAVDILIANVGEAAAVAGGGAMEPAQRALALSRLCRGGAIVTVGAGGAFLAERGAVDHVPALPVRAVDTVGAGDAFAGTFAACIDHGRTFGEAARRATVAGALTCEVEGARRAGLAVAEIEAALIDLPSSMQTLT